MNFLSPHFALTPSCERILKRFSSLVSAELPEKDGDNSADVSGHLILALLQEESLGSKLLHELGLSLAMVSKGCLGDRPAKAVAVVQLSPWTTDDQNAVGEDTPEIDELPWFRSIVERSRRIARRSEGGNEISSEHLLEAMADVQGPVQNLLCQFGISAEAVTHGLGTTPSATTSLPVDFRLDVDPQETESWMPSPARIESDQGRVFAVIDANLNRAREGLRVLEDYARFVRRDIAVTTELKQLRHDLVDAEQTFRHDCPEVMAERNTAADVGTEVSTLSEMRRESLSDVVTANARRVQEALRSLEEFGKTVNGEFAAAIKQLRYRTYSAEQQLVSQLPANELHLAERREQRLQRLQQSRLYVLITESQCSGPWQDAVTEALEGGADVIQLREKNLPDEELIARSLWAADACEQAGALFILNDRVDLASATGAHGIHVGQADGSVEAARARLATDQLLGVSTHNVEQVLEACDGPADYLGVGPVFPSQTKGFTDFPGLSFVADAAASADRPWFAIGGIGQDNLPAVLDAGATRVAVCDAVIGDKVPGMAASQLFQQLTDAEADDQRPAVRIHRT